MGWFNKEDKPKEGEIKYIKLPVDGDKLNSYEGTNKDKEHPVIVRSNNIDGTSNVLGCTTKQNQYKADLEIETNPPMDRKTYARLSDGERVIEDDNLKEDNKHRRINSNTHKKIKDTLG